MTITKKEAILYDLEPINYWDDWTDWRDGMRNWFSDKTRFHKIFFNKWWQPYDIVENNKKLKKQLIIRKLRKAKKI